MNFKTFKTITLVTVIIYIFGYPMIEDKIQYFMFQKDEPVWLDFFMLSDIIRVGIIILALLYFFKSTFNISNQSVMTKKAYCLYIGFFALVLAVPFLSYLPRTEVTAELVTKHNIIGQVSQVYHIEDAKKITVGFTANSTVSQRRLPRSYLTFSYEIEYEDGSIYKLESEDNDMWWDMVNSIDSKAAEAGIIKEIIGKSFYDMMFDFDNTYEFIYRRDMIEKIMEI